MARARNIKPSIFKNELLGTADPLLTLLFESLWCLADKAGRLEDRPLRIKAETFPYRENLDVNVYLTELASLGFICRYISSNIAYIQIVNFVKHQNPHKTEKESDIPEYSIESDSCSIHGKYTLNKGSRPADSLIPDSLIPDSNIPKKSPASPDDYTDEFLQAWDSYPQRPGASKKDSFKAWSARLKAGVGSEIIISGVRRYANFVRVMKTEPQFIKSPQTFFGPGEHYLADWRVSNAGPPKNETPFQERTRNLVDTLTSVGRKNNGTFTIDQ